MTDPVISEDGAAPQPSVSPVDSVTPSPEAELDAKAEESVRDRLGDRYVPMDSDQQEPDTTEPEKESEEAPKDATPEAQGEPEEEIETPPIPKMEPRTSKLDKRVATLYLQNLLLSGEKSVPSVDEIVEELRKVPMEQKIEALHFHRLRQKELKGIRPTGKDELDPEDTESIRDAERESIRQEILAEEHERQWMQSFVTFVNEHPELDETKKEHFDRPFAYAVERLCNGGIPINEAYDIVRESISVAKESVEKAEKRAKQKALSGAISASGDANPSHGGPTWEEMAQLQRSDPEEYDRLIKSGYTPKG